MKQIKEKNGARTLTVVLVVSVTILVFVTLIGALYFTPERMAKHDIRIMAQDYYENYIYLGVRGDVENESELLAAFENYAQEGFPEVKLRQLLHYDNDKNAAYAKDFDNEEYFCDTNLTSVKITPYEPFSKTDYKLEYNYYCEKRKSVLEL